MDVRAAVAMEAGKPLEIMTVQLEGRRPRVLVEIKATGICHTDDFTLSGPIRGPVPGNPRHEGAGVVVDVGLAYVGEAGRPPLYTRNAANAVLLSRKTNLCTRSARPKARASC